MASRIPAPERHAFVGVTHTTSEARFIHKRRFGTLSEIRALKAWLAKRSEIKSLLIVSSGFHLRRVRLCCRAVLPRYLSVRFLAAAESGLGPRSDSWWRNPRSRAIVLCELPKLLLYRVMLSLRLAGEN
jgi:uncharacterized SAM-binding protein YcdF (DUF218 family)